MKNDELSSKLGRKVTNQVTSNMLMQFIASTIEIIFTAILARILAPSDYGIIAAAMLFMSFCELLREIGIGSTIIQMSKISVTDQRTGLTIVFSTAMVIFIIIQLVAPYFSAFMRIPEVEDVLRLMAVVVPIQAISTISQGLLLRNLRAQRVMTIEISSKFIAYASLGVGMAWLGYGYWALVAAAIFEAVLRTIGFTLAARPSLRPAFHKESFRRLTSTGSGFAVSRIINFIALKADVTVIGRYMDPLSLGLYTRAYKLMSQPADLYGKVADRVVFPAMARVQNDPLRLKNAYLRGLRLTALLGLPISIILYLLSPEIIRVLLGDRWLAVVPIFSLLSAATYFRLSARVSGSLLRATASIRSMITSQMFYAALTIGLSLLAIPYGLVAVGGAIGLGVIIWYVQITFLACRVAGVSFGEVLGSHVHGSLLAVGFGAITMPLLEMMRASHIPAILILALMGLSLGFIATMLVLSRPRILLGEEGIRLASHMSEAIRGLRKRVKKA